MKKLFLIFILVNIVYSLFGQGFESYKQLPDTVLFSNALGFEKQLKITLPKVYQENHPHQKIPLIIIFDSQNQRSFNYILNTIDYLSSNDQMPLSAIIGVESTMEHRYGETQLEVSDSNAFGSKNEAFIFDELIPFVRKQFNLSDFTILIGHSRYGYFTSYLLSKRYEDLNAVIAVSPVFQQKNKKLLEPIANIYKNYENDKTLYYRFGIGSDYPDDFYAWKKHLDPYLKTNDRIDFKGQLFIEAYHNVTPGLTVGIALYEIFEYWSKQQNIFFDNNNYSLDTLKELEKNIVSHYGTDLQFALGVLNGKGWFFYNNKYFEKAIATWEILIEEYPGFSDAYLNIITAQVELNENYSQTLKKLKASLKETKLYTEAELNEIQKEILELEK